MVSIIAVASSASQPASQALYPTGDANGDGQVTVTDVFYLVNYLFTNGPAPIGPADANGDGSITVTDIFFEINYLFIGGSAPGTRGPAVVNPTISFFNPAPSQPTGGTTTPFGAGTGLSFFNPAPLPIPSGMASAVGVVNGPAVLTITPAQISRSNAGSLTLSGANLGNATTVTLIPSTGISVGTPTVSADGKTLTVTLGMTGSTPEGFVEVSVSSSTWSTPVTALTRFEVIQ